MSPRGIANDADSNTRAWRRFLTDRVNPVHCRR